MSTDVKIHGLRHLAFKRSDIAHGRIRSVDTRAAAAMDGVEAVFTGGRDRGVPRPDADRDAVPLAPSTARWRWTRCGSWAIPVAVVVARDRYAARDAADAIVVDYESLPAVVDPEEAMTGRPVVLHGDYPTNVALGPPVEGDRHPAPRAGGRHTAVDEAFAAADVVVLAADGEPAARPQRESRRAGWWPTTRRARTR